MVGEVTAHAYTSQEPNVNIFVGVHHTRKSFFRKIGDVPEKSLTTIIMLVMSCSTSVHRQGQDRWLFVIFSKMMELFTYRNRQQLEEYRNSPRQVLRLFSGHTHVLLTADVFTSGAHTIVSPPLA